MKLKNNQSCCKLSQVTYLKKAMLFMGTGEDIWTPFLELSGYTERISREVSTSEKLFLSQTRRMMYQNENSMVKVKKVEKFSRQLSLTKHFKMSLALIFINLQTAWILFIDNTWK